MPRNAPYYAALRAAVARHGVPPKLLATLTGYTPRTINVDIRKLKLENRTLATPGDMRGRMRRLIHDVLPKMETEAARLAEHRGRWTKPQYQAVNQLGRLINQFSELADAAEGEQDEGARQRDQRTAAALKKIDDRIVVLAEALARTMLADARPDVSDNGELR